MMREVPSASLWIGNALDARDTSRLLAAGFEAVIDLAIEEPPCALPREMVYGRFPLVDGEGTAVSRERSVNERLARRLGRRPYLTFQPKNAATAKTPLGPGRSRDYSPHGTAVV